MIIGWMWPVMRWVTVWVCPCMKRPSSSRPYTPAKSHTILEPGMVMAVETWTGGVDPKYGPFGVRLEEDIVVTEDGYELLTRFPVEKICECPF